MSREYVFNIVTSDVSSKSEFFDTAGHYKPTGLTMFVFMSHFVARVLFFVLGVAATFLLLSLWGFISALRPPKIRSTITPSTLGLTYEDVSFRTADNLTLRGWFVPSQKTPAKTIILLHGYPTDKGNILPSLAFLNRMYNLFLFDFRYLGESEGSYTTAGAKEVEDLRAAIRYLANRGAQTERALPTDGGRGITEVGLWGFSMGGAVALMGAAGMPEIKAVVAEAPYARLDLMTKERYRISWLNTFLGGLTRLWGRAFLGIDAKSISPEAAASTLRIPVLLIHSKNDSVVPFSHAKRLKTAFADNPRAEFWFRENLSHGELGGEYEQRIEDFFTRSLQ